MTKQPMSRRQLLRQSAAAAVVVPSAAYAVGYNPTASPELQEWRDARKLYWEAVDGSHEASRRFAAAYVERHPLRGILLARPVRSWDDVAEMAEMAWGDARWFAGDRHPDDDHLPCRELVAPYEAIRTMSGRAMPESAVAYGPGSEGGADV